ncbi:MAG: B12-binding domain-containing radical SAM protein, partial [Candidatus Delongbacteria bacterium]|nr:B12-binding domain-containing radical SAM protein [Candidatus Delongbacteria bacterium]
MNLEKTYNKRDFCKKIMLVGAIGPTLTGEVSSSCLPFGAMALSAFLKERGINCKVVSTAFPRAAEEIFNALDDIDLLGISSMSGPYLNYAISISIAVKKIKPELPIVWGGPHASLMDEDLITNDFVDFVIRGVGEVSLWELVKALKGESSFFSVPGLTWIDRGLIKRNGLSTDFEINALPPLDYSFLSDKYPFLMTDEFSYFSSRGCPFECSYCVASQIYNRRWYNKTEEKVIDELEEAYQKYRFKSVYFWDDNLFVDIKRLLRILESLNNRDIFFQWSGFARVDTFSRLGRETVAELEKRGLKWVSFGAESGSERTLSRIDKGITVDNIKETVLKLKGFNIVCDFSFMGGMPQETDQDFYDTVNLLRWIKKNNSRSSVRMFRFVLYPKMPMLDDHKEIRNLLPKNIYGWSKITYQNAKFPWVSSKINRALTTLSFTSLYSETKRKLSIKNIL